MNAIGPPFPLGICESLVIRDLWESFFPNFFLQTKYKNYFHFNAMLKQSKKVELYIFMSRICIFGMTT